MLQLVELFVMHDEERGGCFGDAGPQTRVVLWNVPGWWRRWALLCVIVGVARESLASKTVAGEGCECRVEAQEKQESCRGIGE